MWKLSIKGDEIISGLPLWSVKNNRNFFIQIAIDASYNRMWQRALIEFKIFLDVVDKKFFDVPKDVVHVEDVFGARVVQEHLPLRRVLFLELPRHELGRRL